MAKIIDADNMRYTKRHEWVMLEDDVATVGITEYGLAELSGVNLVELPAEDAEISAGEEVATVEGQNDSLSVLAPLDGVVVEVNPLLEETPGLVDSDSYGDGWLFRFEVGDIMTWRDLMTAEEYEEYIG